MIIMSNLYNDMIARQKEIISQINQEKIKNSKVTVVGCGGLGGTIIEQLIRSGFENLTILDEDVFDKTNLNRQVRSNIDTLDKPKALITKEAMKKINPNITIDAKVERLCEDNVSKIIKDSDIVIDALDNIYSRVVLARASQEKGIPFIHSAVEKTSGQITVITKNTPSYEELFRLKSKNKKLSDAREYLENLSNRKPQVLGITPAIFGSLQVNEAIKIITESNDILYAPKVLLFDIANYSFRIIEF